MDFSPSPRAADLTERVRSFIGEEIEPVEAGCHAELAARRRGAGVGGVPEVEAFERFGRNGGGAVSVRSNCQTSINGAAR